MDARTQKLEQQRQILELKMKQKRLASGMVLASDARNNSGKSRDSSGSSRRELHGYDGPLQFAMTRGNNPDQIIVMSSVDSLNDTLVQDLTTNNLSSSDLLDVEDDESSPISPNQNGNLSVLVNPLADMSDVANGNEASGPLSSGNLEIEGDMPNDDVATFVLEPAPPRNWFGEVAFRDNNTGYIIKNPRHKLKPNAPYKLRFYVRYNPNGPIPRIISMRLNARQICPVGEVSTETPQGSGQLFTNKPDGMDPLSIPASTGVGFNGGGGSGSRPGARPGNEGEDDFFHGDYFELLKPQGSKQTVLDGATCGIVIKQPRPLITHGQATHEGEFPWHAALYHSQGIDLTYICGASLISSQHLITVAHCVTKRKSSSTVNPDNLVVYLGKFYLRVWKNPGIQDKRVDNIIVHPKYNPQTFSSDIAIIKLSEAARITNYVRPICVFEGSPQLEYVVGKIGTVVGWGFDETGKVTEQLTKASMPIVSQETCIYSFPDFYSRFTSSTTFCAGFKNGTSVCNGDSGGGLILPKSGSDPNNPVWQIRGLVSISVALQNRFRCDSSHYVVFTDIAKYLDFVKMGLSQ